MKKLILVSRLVCIFFGILAIVTLDARHKPLKKNLSPQTEKCAATTSYVSHTRTITLNNRMTNEHIKVNHCGTHMPDHFTLTIHQGSDVGHCKIFSYDKHKEKQENACVQEQRILILNDQLTVDYSYSFAWGMYTGKRRVRFAIPKDTDTVDVSFSFNKKERVLIPQAIFIGPIESLS